MKTDRPLHSSRLSASEATHSSKTRAKSQSPESASQHIRNALQLVRTSPADVDTMAAVEARLWLALRALEQSPGSEGWGGGSFDAPVDALRGSLVRDFLGLLQAQAPQDAFTFEEVRALMPEGIRGDGRFIRDMLRHLVDSGDLLAHGERGAAKAYVLIAPLRPGAR